MNKLIIEGHAPDEARDKTFISGVAFYDLFVQSRAVQCLEMAQGCDFDRAGISMIGLNLFPYLHAERRLQEKE